MATTLACRLLCASNCAYAVSGAGSVPKKQPFYDAAGFTDTPVGIAAGTDKINACVVGATQDGVVVAFRGTLPPGTPDRAATILDWFNDIRAELIPAKGIAGLVHEGFWTALDSLWSDVAAEVGKRLQPSTKLYVTGHSKGGAMANLAAMRFESAQIDSTVVTFAAAHPADEAFAADYNGKIGSTRYEYADDIVPHLPPSLPFRQTFQAVPFFAPLKAQLARDLNYSAVGTLKFIDWNGAIADDSPGLRARRYASLTKLMLEVKFDQIVRDHSIDCGSGYATAICPTDVCP